jgi:hypothetical protein
MANWIEFEVDAAFGDADSIEWIQLFNKTVTYYAEGLGHDVVYIDAAAALLAYNAWVVAHPPPIPPYLVDGDLVILHRQSAKVSITEEHPTIFRKAPDFAGDYWVFEQDGKIMAIDAGVIVIKL